LWLIESLATARIKRNFAVWAYVLMPEHVHLVIYPREDQYSISDILTDIKQPVTRAAVKYVLRSAPSFLANMRDGRPNGKIVNRFWQRGGGYDRNLVRPETVHQVIDYIHANPVRRGLVGSPEDWAWSSARYYAGRSDVPLIPDDDELPLRNTAR
jgi:putative transposase